MEDSSAIVSVIPFLRAAKWRVLVLSILVVVPCLWHRHIEAGDLASHTYNGWLAQLIGKGEAPGLYIVRQWNNVLFDIALANLAKLTGVLLAEKILVPLCVLIFFWGTFALVSAVSGRAAWSLAPCFAMLAYGYTFHMGFVNYYLSLGLGCFSLAVVWRGRGLDWLAVGALLVLSLLAHPIGFLWAVGTLVYVTAWRKLHLPLRLVLPACSVATLWLLRWYLAHHDQFEADWPQWAFFRFNGADQLILFGERYAILSWALLSWGVACFAREVYLRKREGESWKPLLLPLELYLLAVCVTAFLPENLHISLYAAWIGLLVSRLTTISAIFGLCAIGFLRLRKWQTAVLVAGFVIFFVFVYQDTRTLDRIESQADTLLSDLPPGTRIVGMIDSQEGSRIEFVHHLIDRACIGRCFSYANYEPSSGQFRIRVRSGSSIAAASDDDSEAMQDGTYVVRPEDLPMEVIYQCDDDDPTTLCLRGLKAGDKAGPPPDTETPQ